MRLLYEHGLTSDVTHLTVFGVVGNTLATATCSDMAQLRNMATDDSCEPPL